MSDLNQYNSFPRSYGGNFITDAESNTIKNLRKWLTFIMAFIVMVFIGVICTSIVRMANQKESFETANNMSSRYPYGGPGMAIMGSIPAKVDLGGYEVDNPNYVSKSLAFEPTDQNILGNQVWKFKPNPYDN